MNSGPKTILNFHAKKLAQTRIVAKLTRNNQVGTNYKSLMKYS